MKVLFFGYGDMGCQGLEFLLQEGEPVVAVITHRDDPAEKQWFRSVAEVARAATPPAGAVACQRCAAAWGY